MCRSERLLAHDRAASGQGNFVLGFRKPQGLDRPILGTAALPQSCPSADVGVGQALPWLQCRHHLCAKAEPCCPLVQLAPQNPWLRVSQRCFTCQS